MEISPTQSPSRLKVWLWAARPKTLWAAVSPVLVGVAMAVADHAAHPIPAVLALLGAVFIQIGTNFYNDYADFVKGADTSERKGPLRVTMAGLVSPRAMKRATVVAFALAVAAGGYLIWRGGWPIVIIGVSSILFGVLYTAGRYSLSYLGIADVFVFVFFGPVAVGGTYYVQALTLRPEVLVAGIAPGLLSVAILLVNNIRDIEEDRAAGKRTLIVRLGRNFGVRLYAVCLYAALITPVLLFAWTKNHPWAMATVALLPVAVSAVRKLRTARDPQALNKLLGETARLLLYALVFSVGWVL